MTDPVIIPWIADQPTKYSTDESFKKAFAEEPAYQLSVYVDYALWECSTEHMIKHGLPTDADVGTWIQWLEQRVDVADPDIQNAIFSCKEFTKEQSRVGPMDKTEPSEGSDTGSIPVRGSTQA